MSTQDETKLLGRFELISIAVGNVIGGGIMSVVGVAIGLTGRSVALALVLSGILTFISILPKSFAAATVRMNGGEYSLATLLGGEFFAGVYIAFWLTNFFGASLYCTSFAQYFEMLVPGLNPSLVALALLAIFYVLNILGIKVAAKAQNYMVVILIAALLLFSFFGFGHVKPGFFQQPDFMRNGFIGIMYAAALMNFACGGAGHIVSFGKQSKNPTRDIPISIVIASLVVTVIYAMVAIVAAGVLPISEVEGQSLAKVAFEVLPYPLYLFFIVGGAMIALATSLNALMGWLPPPIVQACEDGWLPKKFGESSKRFGTPHWILTFIFVMAGLFIVAGWDVGDIATVGTFLANAGTLVVVITLIRLPKVLESKWKKSIFHVSDWIYKIIWFAALIVTIVFEYFLFDILSTGQKYSLVAFTLIAMAYSYLMIRRKNLTIDTSFEED
ncbi:MAG: amino acid permease [Tissierellia bacterium]|nr:amino acid permease [Tissierellia bacterium]